MLLNIFYLFRKEYFFEDAKSFIKSSLKLNQKLHVHILPDVFSILFEPFEYIVCLFKLDFVGKRTNYKILLPHKVN